MDPMNWEDVAEWPESQSEQEEGGPTKCHRANTSGSECGNSALSESWDVLRVDCSSEFDDKDSWSVVSTSSECGSRKACSSVSVISPHKATTGLLPKDHGEQQQFATTEADERTESDEEFWAKPNTDKLRQKHEQGGRRRKLMGHTGRRIGFMGPSCCSIPVIEGGDKEFLTAVETKAHRGRCAGWPGPYKYFLNTNREWEELPALLERECVGIPEETRASGRYGYHKVTTYKLRPQLFMPSKTEVQLDRFIYFKPRQVGSLCSAKFVPQKIFAEIQTEQPHFVKGKSLCWSYNNPRNSRTVIMGSQREWPLTKKNKPALHGRASWDVEVDGQPSPATSMRTFLEIDLGESQVITAVSTQGGHPPVRRYPHVTSLTRSFQPTIPPGHCHVEGHLFKGEYTGPFWNVLDPDWNAAAEDKCRRESKLRWVLSYELLWRSDRGKTWNSLGIFKGNDDTTTEKAHLLTGFHLRCRYLRFVPMECENGGAMRVAVYGNPKESPNARESSKTKHSRPASTEDNAVDDDVTVEYRFHHPSDVVPERALHRDACTWSGKDWYYPKNYQKRARQDLKKQAKGCNHSKTL